MNFIDESDIILIDSCIVVALMLQEQGCTNILEVLEEAALQNKLSMNEISEFETRYILKQRLRKDVVVDIDALIDSLIETHGLKLYPNTRDDFRLASSIKAEGGLSPYDALMLAQMQKNPAKKYTLFTKDLEFKAKKFIENYPIVFLQNL